MALWREVSKCDPIAKAMSLRHYSQAGQHEGQRGRELGPPGQKIVLLTDDQKAVWGSHRPAPWAGVKRKDGFDGWCCFIYRNEGTAAATTYELIAEGVARTVLAWGLPPEGFLTYIAVDFVAAENPGGSFQAVGFKKAGYITSGKLGRLRKMVMPPAVCAEVAMKFAAVWMRADAAYSAWKEGDR